MTTGTKTNTTFALFVRRMPGIITEEYPQHEDEIRGAFEKISTIKGIPMIEHGKLHMDMILNDIVHGSAAHNAIYDWAKLSVSRIPWIEEYSSLDFSLVNYDTHNHKIEWIGNINNAGISNWVEEHEGFDVFRCKVSIASDNPLPFSEEEKKMDLESTEKSIHE